MPEPIAKGRFVLFINGKLVESTTGWPRAFPSREELDAWLRRHLETERYFTHRVPSVVIAQVVESTPRRAHP